MTPAAAGKRGRDSLDGGSRAEVERMLRDGCNWGRWGSDDQIGAINLITPEKRVAAAGLVRTGQAISLSREFPKTPAPNNPRPAQHFLRHDPIGATDFYGIEYHGQASTHVDALCHVFDGERRVWNGRPADEVITTYGARWASIDHWRHGLLTRGVLLDVPRFRGEDYVRQDVPVTAAELVEVARAEEVTISPGDAVVIYSGRDRWDGENIPWGGDVGPDGVVRRPGLHPSCLEFLRSTDCSILAWDMMDVSPSGTGGIPWNVHGAIWSFGIALVDNCELGLLAAACAAADRYEFMFVLAPLVVVGGTGSPANPLAVL